MISTEAIKGMKMKASELIKELEKAIEEHGDLEVEHNNEVDGRIDSVGVVHSNWDKKNIVCLFLP